jgi:hypothetical protein
MQPFPGKQAPGLVGVCWGVPAVSALASRLARAVFVWRSISTDVGVENACLLISHPGFVSTIHVVIGAIYCIFLYLIGAKKASFERVGWLAPWESLWQQQARPQ